MNSADRRTAAAVLTRIKLIVELGHEVRFLPGIFPGSCSIVVGVGKNHFHMPENYLGTIEEFIQILDDGIRCPEGK